MAAQRLSAARVSPDVVAAIPRAPLVGLPTLLRRQSVKKVYTFLATLQLLTNFHLIIQYVKNRHFLARFLHH
jgi:hypothetical protein